MKIGFDATSLCRKITGIESYTLNLLKTVMKTDLKNEYIVLFRKEIHPDIAPFKNKARFFICPSNNQIACEQIWIPLALKKESVDLVHFPAFPPGFFINTKFVMTLHDATMWRYANTLSWKNKLYMKPLCNIAIRRAEKIITVSESSKKDLVEFCDIYDSKIVNTSESISDNFKVIESKSYLEKIKIKHNLPDKFILSVCSLEPRKNLLILLEAYAKFKKIAPNVSHKLVLVGRKAWGSDAVAKIISKLNIGTEVKVIGHVIIDDLVGIYNLTDLFVYPSIYEGFGLPPLEAMACGVPVIASNTSSMPEVLDDAAILTDPHDSDQIANKMAEVLTDSGLKIKLKEKGLERVKNFSWDKVAEKTLNVYETIKYGS
ncbi:MAG: glycosyltransferase family 1 protein [Candidatus Omnitrophica bacterium]|nr:glycosyltransferase family 1 protein [Candidatus Omnitrophota bacterium]